MSVYDDYEVPESEGVYLKFQAGKTQRLRICSDPVQYISTFERPGQPPQDSLKYAWLVWNVDSAIPQVLQGGAKIYKAIAGFAKDPEYGDPSEYDIKITANGEKLERTYEVIASPRPYVLSEKFPEAIDEVSKLDLISLIEKGKGNTNVHYLQDVVAGTVEQPKVANHDNDWPDDAQPKDEKDW